MNESRVSSVRRLLQEAKVPDYGELARRRGPLGTIRRKFLIQQVMLLASCYSLQPHVDAFVHGAGREAITGLELDQLEQLVGKLERHGSALDLACDFAALPPAR